VSKIPEARRRLAELKQRTRSPDIAAEIDDIIGLMIRRPVIRRAPVKCRAPTEEDKQMMREYARLHPDKTQQEIGVFLGFTAGRVSEALHEDQ
jgi:hypothetical protein